ncbi:MAG: MBL fold metallo-hydrolase, partial [Myxococcales bacterium]|nr:MBL fold metallo-hydrolase [Myxococcales bacterium]
MRGFAPWLIAMSCGVLACDDGDGASASADATRCADAGSMPDRAVPDAAPVVDAAPPGPVDIDAGPDPTDVARRLAEHCEAHVGPARVEEVAPDLFVAIGYDLANTILLRTADGNVIVDAGMSPARARATRAALDEVAPGPVAAVIYTHSHVDHLGGASVWVDDGTPVFATEALLGNLVGQYGAFAQAESARGRLQFGQGVPEDLLPCSALGRRADVDAARNSGARLPTETFTGHRALDFGGVAVELFEAPGETEDQLFVWIPHLDALLPGDNYYAAFPNLYTLRGTTPRPVDGWLRSLDAMRRLDPAVLAPSHTAPLLGRPAIREALTGYRDGIQWVRDAVVRGANAGLPLDAIVARAALPAHLAAEPALAELYGQVDWSARALYGNHLGWFDGREATLYPPRHVIAREIALMGGA